MMLLLDTHALYWYIEGSSDLSVTARRLIQDASNDILISPASFWEMAIKISLGKWQLNRPYGEFIDIALNRYSFQMLPILPAHRRFDRTAVPPSRSIRSSAGGASACRGNALGECRCRFRPVRRQPALDAGSVMSVSPSRQRLIASYLTNCCPSVKLDGLGQLVVYRHKPFSAQKPLLLSKKHEV